MLCTAQVEENCRKTVGVKCVVTEMNVTGSGKHAEVTYIISHPSESPAAAESVEESLVSNKDKLENILMHSQTFDAGKIDIHANTFSMTGIVWIFYLRAC